MYPNSGGDQDFRVWRWKDIADKLHRDTPGSSQKADVEPVYQSHLQRKAMGFRGALLPFSEINAIATSRQDPSRVFLAGGDGIAHEWDLTSLQCARQYEGHRDYLHAVQFVSHSKELITGSEDGTVGIWDARSAKRTAELRPSDAFSGLWVGSVTTDSSETWLACGGGGIASAKSGSSGGFVSMWHLPSRVPVHFTATGRQTSTTSRSTRRTCSRSQTSRSSRRGTGRRARCCLLRVAPSVVAILCRGRRHRSHRARRPLQRCGHLHDAGVVSFSLQL
ncbi:hypothetical protein PINS_up018330 [Pythium insidiosum]|nr:hypothetical protein PINS_up018330 [Pythium insidiosum]